LEEAQTLADRVAIIKDGRIVIEGAPQELGSNAGTAPYRIAYQNRDGSTVVLETDDPTMLLHELTSAALARGERLQGLTVTRPTLEDVYLELTAGDTGHD
jgi:ABC-2 type transport system ATP-binding protein